MRKIKKINGFLVVKFNDREKREYEGTALGEYDIKSGIASLSDEGVAEFTSLAALTAKATKSTAGEMTSLFATGYGIYKDYYSDLSDMEFGEMFSAGISDAVRAFKTSGSGMAQAIQNLGASATTAQVPLEEQLSVLGMRTPWAGRRSRRATRPPCEAAASSRGRPCSTTSIPR